MVMIIITLKLIETLALEAQKTLPKKSILHKPCGRPPKRQLFGIYYRMRVTFPPTRKTLVSTNTKADLMHNGKMAEERTNNSPYNRT